MSRPSGNSANAASLAEVPAQPQVIHAAWRSRLNMLKLYYELAKPGIIYGNLLTACAGFLLAAKGHPQLGLLAATLSGTALVIASACAYNNYIDRPLDKRMQRTRRRGLVTGSIPGRAALAYATVLGLSGFAILAMGTSTLVLGIGIVAFIDYVVFYGLAKRHGPYGTLVGSISGSAPVVAGYVAAAGRFDLGAGLVFLILTLWQMPHFYAIAMYRLDDYKSAGLPVLPAVHGLPHTKRRIIWYVSGFALACAALWVFGYAGVSYLVVMLALSGRWLWLGLRGLHTNDDTAWAKQMFLFSLLVILALSIMLSVGSVIA